VEAFQDRSATIGLFVWTAAVISKTKQIFPVGVTEMPRFRLAFLSANHNSSKQSCFVA
jgi:hypothetical protein